MLCPLRCEVARLAGTFCTEHRTVDISKKCVLGTTPMGDLRRTLNLHGRCPQHERCAPCSWAHSCILLCFWIDNTIKVICLFLFQEFKTKVTQSPCFWIDNTVEFMRACYYIPRVETKVTKKFQRVSLAGTHLRHS